MKGKGPNPNAVQWVFQNPESDNWSNEDLARKLKQLGFYSKKTYVRDIRIERIRTEALALMRQRNETKSTQTTEGVQTTKGRSSNL
jgi:hypothetical protein